MTRSTADARAELAQLAASLHAHLEVEAELGGLGLPRSHLPTTPPTPPPSHPRVASPTPEAPEDPPPTAMAADSPVQETIAQGRPPVPSSAESEPESSTPASGELVRVGAALDPEDTRRRLGVLAEEAAACTRCALHHGRTHSVFARGSAEAQLVFVGEGPGRDEDMQGLPFVGKAGKLLDRMIAAMGYQRDEVYICNVVKCRPPENRTPKPDEAAACERFLVGQLELVAPQVIVALGKCAADNLGCVPGKGRWRGIWRQWRGVPVMPTYHPAFLLRSPEFKRPVWQDLQQVMQRLGKEPPQRKR